MGTWTRGSGLPPGLTALRNNQAPCCPLRRTGLFVFLERHPTSPSPTGRRHPAEEPFRPAGLAEPVPPTILTDVLKRKWGAFPSPANRLLHAIGGRPSMSLVPPA